MRKRPFLSIVANDASSSGSHNTRRQRKLDQQKHSIKNDLLQSFVSTPVKEILTDVLTTLYSTDSEFNADGFEEDIKQLRHRGNIESKLFKTETNSLFCKQIITTDTNAVKNFIKEIVLQKYAFSIQKECGFQTPEIISFGKTNTYIQDHKHVKTTIFFIMTGIPYPTLNELNDMDYFHNKQELCDKVGVKITQILKKLMENLLHHNDLNKGNIKYDIDTEDIYILDWGEAKNGLDPSDIGMERNFIFKCENIRGKRKSEKVLHSSNQRSSSRRSRHRASRSASHNKIRSNCHNRSKSHSRSHNKV